MFILGNTFNSMNEIHVVVKIFCFKRYFDTRLSHEKKTALFTFDGGCEFFDLLKKKQNNNNLI